MTCVRLNSTPLERILAPDSACSAKGIGVQVAACRIERAGQGPTVSQSSAVLVALSSCSVGRLNLGRICGRCQSCLSLFT